LYLPTSKNTPSCDVTRRSTFRTTHYSAKTWRAYSVFVPPRYCCRRKARAHRTAVAPLRGPASYALLPLIGRRVCLPTYQPGMSRACTASPPYSSRRLAAALSSSYLHLARRDVAILYIVFCKYVGGSGRWGGDGDVRWDRTCLTPTTHYAPAATSSIPPTARFPHTDTTVACERLPRATPTYLPAASPCRVGRTTTACSAYTTRLLPATYILAAAQLLAAAYFCTGAYRADRRDFLPCRQRCRTTGPLMCYHAPPDLLLPTSYAPTSALGVGGICSCGRTPPGGPPSATLGSTYAAWDLLKPAGLFGTTTTRAIPPHTTLTLPYPTTTLPTFFLSTAGVVSAAHVP